MPTNLDEFAIAYPAVWKYAHRLLTGNVSIDWLRDTLLACSWTTEQEYAAEATLSITFIETAQPPDPPYEPVASRFFVSCTWPTYLQFHMFDPNNESPIQDDGIIWVPMGDTTAESFQNLCDSMQDNTGWTASYADRFGNALLPGRVRMVCPTTGTAGNGTQWLVAGAVGIGEDGRQGGYMLQAPSQHSFKFIDHDGTHIKIATKRGTEPLNTEHLLCNQPYHVFASSHQLGLFADQYSTTEAWIVVCPWFLASAPSLDPRLAGLISHCSFDARFNGYALEGWNAERTSLNAGDGSGLCIGSMRLYANGGGPVHTAQGNPIVQDALVRMTDGGAIDGFVGKLWGAVVVSDAYSLGQKYKISGRDFLCVASLGSGWWNNAASLMLDTVERS
jgi:hypothetical protein